MKELSNTSVTLNQTQPCTCTFTISIPARIIDTCYKHMLNLYTQKTYPRGLNKKSKSKIYIELTSQKNILDHLKEFLMHHMVLDQIYKIFSDQKIIPLGHPRITSISLSPGSDAHYEFECTNCPKFSLDNWASIPCKMPRRKQYKDIDRQVDECIDEENGNREKHSTDVIQEHDWVCISTTVLNSKNKPLIPNHNPKMWIRIGHEESDRNTQELFLGKKIGDSISTQNSALHYKTTSNFTLPYTYKVTILDIVPYAYICWQKFKTHFGLTNHTELCSKLSEVFSFRNDISQRREIAEATLKAVINKQKINLPMQAVFRAKEETIKELIHNPDYYVYKAHPKFDEIVMLLAKKQLSESALVDQLSHKERIRITQQDVHNYIHLHQRPRTKEFIYFTMPETKIEEQERVVSYELMRYHCLQEKTLNILIKRLSSSQGK